MKTSSRQSISEVRVGFETKREQHNASAVKYESRELLLSWVRIGIFVLITAALIYLIQFEQYAFAVVLGFLGIIVFGVAVNQHRKTKFSRLQFQWLKIINQEELDRLDLNLDQLEGGSEFIDAKHPYSSDLDLFGSSSLFKLLNRSAMTAAKEKLAQWMLNPASHQEIVKRQEAISEMKDKQEWGQNLQALTRHTWHLENAQEQSKIDHWLKEEGKEISQSKLTLSWLVAGTSVVIITLILLGIVSWHFIAIPVVAGLLLIKNEQPTILEAGELSNTATKLLNTYKLLATEIAKESWDSEFLQERKKRLLEPELAITQIRRLKRLFDFLDSRSNGLYWVFNTLFVLDIHFVAAIGRWKRKNGSQVAQWIEAISEFEAIAGMAGFAGANPQYPFPHVSKEDHFIRGVGIEHPLINPHVRVSNDFNLESPQHIGIVTGSNMSGKSTFLRTIGLNLVLMRMGAPVCAESIESALYYPFTSMRTMDDLSENVSSFYAELKRIEMLLQLIGSESHVFFLLDEILKGTNTHDRQLGARSLIRQLDESKSTGLVSTHDIALGDLGEKAPSITNFNFGSEVKNHELLFDYKLKQGVCQSFNASELMAKIGIRLEGDNGTAKSASDAI